MPYGRRTLRATGLVMTVTWAMSKPPDPDRQYRPIRAREEIVSRYELIGALQTDGQRRIPGDVEMLAGTAVAFEWVLGITDIAPVSGRLLPDRHTMYLRAEEAAAQDVIERLRPVPDDLTEEFVGGMYHAISWARGFGNDNPPPAL